MLSRTNDDLKSIVRSYMLDMIKGYIADVDEYIVINAVNVNPSSEFINWGDVGQDVKLLVELSDTQSYDGQYLQSLKVGSMIYDFEDVEIEAGYSYTLVMGYAVSSLKEYDFSL